MLYDMVILTAVDCDSRSVGRVRVSLAKWIKTSSNSTGAAAVQNIHSKVQCTQQANEKAVQGHSRSPILVPVEKLYTTSY